jgi:hypothetical protein
MLYLERTLAKFLNNNFTWRIKIVMDFTFESYQKLLQLLIDNHYFFSFYENWDQYDKCVILRHDIDQSPMAALQFAELESAMQIHSTYFVLLTSDFYNVFSKMNISFLKNIVNLGHEIGLHFDEMQYPNAAGNPDLVCEQIKHEANILSDALNTDITTVSMHRPSKETLNADLHIPGIINSYGKEFFNEFKYLSDSRLHWREPVLDIVKSNQYKKLHILTHAFSYNEKPISMHDHLKLFVMQGNIERYNILDNNFSSLSDVLPKAEII